jgi:DNA-binding response OmpR family regulator
MRVLVAEDKPRMAHYLQRVLQREGYSVELAFDGEQALSMGLGGGMDLWFSMSCSRGAMD